MDAVKPVATFDPTRTFYPLVFGFLAQLHGFLELASRSLRNHVADWTPDRIAALVGSLDAESLKPSVARTLLGDTTPLLAPLSLAANAGAAVSVDTEALARDIFENPGRSLQPFILASAGSLLILAWESTAPAHTKHAHWEFLRHCRNAAAHGGVFTFRGPKPLLPATWRGLSIERQMHGSLLFVDPPTPGFLGPGDVLHLLADIEKAFPNA